MRKPNISIMQTRITDKIRVSTAAIYYDEAFGERFQYETWIFSDDPKQSSQQVIHGSGQAFDFYYLKESIKVHNYIAKNLKERRIKQ